MVVRNQWLVLLNLSVGIESHIVLSQLQFESSTGRHWGVSSQLRPTRDRLCSQTKSDQKYGILSRNAKQNIMLYLFIRFRLKTWTAIGLQCTSCSHRLPALWTHRPLTTAVQISSPTLCLSCWKWMSWSAGAIVRDLKITLPVPHEAAARAKKDLSQTAHSSSQVRLVVLE